MTVRRRALVVVAIALPVGWLFLDIGLRLAGALLYSLRGSNPNDIGCGGSVLSVSVGVFNGCNSLKYRVGYAAVELVIGIVLVGLICYALARWVTTPLRQMSGAIEQLGPTNLGLRLRQPGPTKDETRRLAESVDRMLDRVADGYEAQRRFASNASHELRTPLATQRALIEVSLSAALTPEQIELLSRQLLATNERNEKLIEGLLVLAETERGVVTMTRLDLGDIVTSVAESMQAFAREKDVSLTVESTPVLVVGEHALLERLVVNLVQNAIKYNVTDGTVRVGLLADGVVVSNTGPIVPGDQVAGLFEPFRRLSGERLDHGGGAGLGLTIARAIVAAHDGTITARANPEGGMTVQVRLSDQPR